MEAAFYEKRDNKKVRCRLCPHNCIIGDGSHGVCRIRGNRDGVLYADSYGELVTLAVDPIEKKPLYHFHPTKPILSTGVNGCNFHCVFCQNASISQGSVRIKSMKPEELVHAAESEGSIGIAWTYTEPFIWFEYIRDTGRLVHDRGMVNVLVSNGYVNEEPLRDILPIIDAVNIDIKAMNDDYYREMCGGRLEDVLRTVRIAAEETHVEVTNLIVTNRNDADEDFHALTDFIAGIRPTIPVHFSRYFPQYKLHEPPTKIETLQRAYDIASEKLPYVYIGNVHVNNAANTVCPSCGAELCNRTGYTISCAGIREGACATCGARADFIGV